MIKVSRFLFSKSDVGEPIEDCGYGSCNEDWAANQELVRTGGRMRPVLDSAALPDSTGGAGDIQAREALTPKIPDRQ